MPKKSKLKLLPVDSGKETLGQRLTRIRKEKGLTQQQVAERTGLIQVLVSDYERDRLRLSAEMAIRFATVLGVTTDELLYRKPAKPQPPRQVSRRFLRRMEQIEKLPPLQQTTLLRTIDTFLRAAER